MNRREAMMALLTLPTVTSVARADVKPNDVIVIKVDAILSDKEAERIKTMVEQAFPDQKCLVLSGSVSMEIVRQPA